MRTLSKVFVACGVLALLAAPASAQNRQRFGGFGGFGGGPGMLLQNEGVQKELKMTEEQTTKTKEIVAEIQAKHMDDFAALRDLDMQERLTKMREIQTAIAAETKKGLEGVLKAEQSKRLDQINLQQQGLVAFNSPEVDKILKLSAEQKEKVKTIADDMQAEMRSAFQGGGAGGDFQEAMKKVAEMRKESLNKGIAVLTDEQKKSWKEMTGEPFEVKMELGAFKGRKGKGKDKDK